METTAKGFWYATFILLFAASVGMAAEPSAVPKRLNAEVQTMRASYRVELSDGTLTCTTFGPRRSNPQHTVITPTEAQWREFRQTLGDLKVWQWRGEYVDPGTVDGMGWSLDVAYDDDEVKSSGYNVYPNATGEPVGGSTSTFRRYHAALKSLTGGCAWAGADF